MNLDSSRHQFFHSSISIISIKPIRNQCEEMDFFTNPLEDQRDLTQEFQKTEFVNSIPESESPIYGSLLDKILLSTHSQPENDSFESNAWISFKNDIGCSESESEQIQSQDAKKNRLSLPKKTKAIFRQQFSQISQNDDQKEKSDQTSRRFQNETKNIPKNYGKAIIAFSIKNFKKYHHREEFASISFQDFKRELVQKRKSINSIAGLKNLWMDFKYARCMRLLSNEFLRRHSLSYIFNSRISNISPHVKYRYKLCEAITSPLSFSYIKDF